MGQHILNTSTRERLHAWLIVNETELSLLSILLVATAGSHFLNQIMEMQASL